MFAALAKKIFGTANDRILRGMKRPVADIAALEAQMKALSDAELQAQTAKLRDRLAKGETLDDILPEAFATCREASVRVLGMRHFDVQMIGGIVLHQGRIAEMKTGEGKTLVATLAVYLNALEGKGVHVVTVNDYLARRDSEWMGRLYNFLGLSVGVIVHGLSDAERRAAYGCDITYGTNNEFGFDYLRDNMKFQLNQMVQRPFNFAIVDEVDSILIDEARTPLIISGPAADSSELYNSVDAIVRQLGPENFEKDEKQRTVALNEVGTTLVEKMLGDAGLLKSGGLYDLPNLSLVHHVQQSLRAHNLFTRDVDYMIKDGQVVIVDEFTGRMMPGRRYSDGLHQALEAKEHVEVQQENQTLASITFQNYFRLYPKLAGMTGTASTEAAEFGEIYKLEVVEIPTNVNVIRRDEDDEVYRTAREKYDAIATMIEDCRSRQQPVLVGTISIEKSEIIADYLKKRGIPHQVLNARYHEQEAYIIADAGAPGAVTIATNMAGRGTDIQLGGNADMRIKRDLSALPPGPERDAAIAGIRAGVQKGREIVLAAGGLCVIGTERHEARRIDNQLRGRSGRQGDPGVTKFFLSLEDDLMRIFGSQRMDSVLVRLGLKEGEAIVHPWINKAIEKAQQKVEHQHFEIRKNLLRFDDVMNDQRKAIYSQRKEIMEATDCAERVAELREEAIEAVVLRHVPAGSYADAWDVPALKSDLLRVFGLDLPVDDWAKEEGVGENEIIHRVAKASDERMAAKAANMGPDVMRQVERSVLLQVMDQTWKEHLLALDHLRQGINLRAYGQRDPLNEYKREAFLLFESMVGQMKENTVQVLSHLEIRRQNPADLVPPAPPVMQERRDDPALAALAAAEAEFEEQGGERGPALGAAWGLAQPPQTVAPDSPESWVNTPRNAPCPCGSGKKYKQCHGVLT